MTRHSTDSSLTEDERDVLRKRETTGWFVNEIAEDGEGPGFAYSFGLYERYRHPEIIIFGLPPDVMHQLINDIGILPHGVSHLSFPFAVRTKFSRSIPKPVLSSCRLYTDCHRIRKQVSFRLILGIEGNPSFDSALCISRCVIGRFAFAHLPNTYLTSLQMPFPKSYTIAQQNQDEGTEKLSGKRRKDRMWHGNVDPPAAPVKVRAPAREPLIKSRLVKGTASAVP